MKKLIAFLLASLIISSSLIACGEQAAVKADEPASKDDQSADILTEAESSEPDADQIIRDRYRDTDYGGYEFTVAGYEPGGFFYNKISQSANEIWYEEQTGDIYEDAVYKRNIMTEELLNIKIKPLYISDYESAVKKIVAAGDDTIDVGLGPLAYQMNLAASGYLANLRNLNSVELDQPWFDQAIIKNYSYKGRQLYALTGAGNIFDDYAVPVIFYGRDILTQYGLDDPADLVPDGKWTMETMMTMGETVTSDIDGDGKMTNSDSYGFLDNGGQMIHLMEATGFTMTSVGDDGIPYINCFKPGYVEAAEYIYNRIIQSPSMWTGSNGTAIGILKENRALFYYELLGCINELRDMESSFSLLPCPKLNEQQETYVSAVNSVWCTSFSIPVSSSDPERSGTVLNTLNAFSVNTVNSVLYELLLGAKLVREEKTQVMLDYILNNKKYCWGNGYSWSSSISNLLNNQFSAKSFVMVSKIEAQSEKMQKSLDKFLEKFDELG